MCVLFQGAAVLSRMSIVTRLATLALAGMQSSETQSFTRVVQSFATTLGAIAFHDTSEVVQARAVEVCVCVCVCVCIRVNVYVTSVCLLECASHTLLYLLIFRRCYHCQ